jgi:hypothetical protein
MSARFLCVVVIGDAVAKMSASLLCVVVIGDDVALVCTIASRGLALGLPVGLGVDGEIDSSSGCDLAAMNVVASQTSESDIVVVTLPVSSPPS